MNLRTITAAIAALCLLSATATAQEAPAVGPWTDPLGRFTMDFAAHGFTPLPASDDPAEVIVVEHGALQRSANGTRMCDVREQRVPRSVAMDQGQANAHLYSRSERDIAAGLNGQLSEYARSRVDGISVVSFRFDIGSVQQYWRLFFLAHNGGVVQVAIACGGTAPLTMLDLSIMDQTLSTLRFLPEASP
jgi:hypothetical protein